MNLLIPYVQLRHHEDPNLHEFTYGDSGARARKLKKLRAGDYVFFHTTVARRKCITAYYVVDRVLDTVEACNNRIIPKKYKNPHLVECLEGRRPVNGEDDVVLFGDPIESRVLDHPLPFDKSLSTKLSLGITFPVGRQECQVIGSATRSWRDLGEKDVAVLLAAIDTAESLPRPDELRSTEEVAETLERDVEDYLARNPGLIGDDLKLVARQLPIKCGRIDLLFENPEQNLVVVEVKLGRVGRDAMHQVQAYMHELRGTKNRKRVEGVLVCAGVMPAFEAELRKQSKVKIMVYGWKMHVQPW